LAGRGLRRAALVVSLKSACVWKLGGLAGCRRLNGPMLRGVHVQREMCAPAVIIIKIAGEGSL
jgi:hypothetical protein